MAQLLPLLLVTGLLCWGSAAERVPADAAVGRRRGRHTRGHTATNAALHSALVTQGGDLSVPKLWSRRRRLLRLNAAVAATPDDEEAEEAEEAEEEEEEEEEEEDSNHSTEGDPEAAEEASLLPGGDGEEDAAPGVGEDAAEEDTAERTFPAAEDAEAYKELGCDKFEVTYQQIDHDLAIHRRLGAHLNATRYIMAALRRKSGMGIGFFGGRAYLLTPIQGEDWNRLAHHAKLLLAYLRLAAHLERAFGPALPDVVLVVTSSDTPRYVSPLLVNVSTPRPYAHPHPPDFVPGPYPVAGICKSDFWPDLLLIPNFHFHTKLYDNATLSHIPEYRDEHPWASREPRMFGRFSHYSLHRHPGDHTTAKLGMGGQHLPCTDGNTSCSLREHFISQVAKKDRAGRLDVRFSGMRPMAHHADYKYLLNLNGQSISSRLEQLLPLGAAVFTENSGYYAYYYRTLLQHRVNVLEFWRRVPEEVFEELDWAQAHDEQAAAIAAEGVRTAATYLTGSGRTCYWYRLLHGLSRTLRFRPRLSQWPEAVPVRQVLESDLVQAPGGQALAEAPWAP